MVRRSEFRVSLPNEPGQLARVCVALNQRGVNIRTIAGIAGAPPVLAFITEQESETREVLNELGLSFHEVELLTVNLTNIPGEIAAFAKKLKDANVNIESIYLLQGSANEGEIGFTVSDPDRAKQILGLG